MDRLTLYPYLLSTCWVFDDPRTGLKEEAFVLGMSEMITRLVETKGIPDAGCGFALQFSDAPIAGQDVELTWMRRGTPDADPSLDTGNWYRGTVAGREMEGWLCPALGLYFRQLPRHIYVRAEPLPAGIKPIWDIDRDSPRARRFVSAPPQNRN